MDPYTFSRTLGGAGLGVMALSEFAHATHAGHGHDHDHAAASLTAAERTAARRVRAGDRFRIEAVDTSGATPAFPGLER